MVNRFFELNENKLFYKSIEDFLNWLEKRSNNLILAADRPLLESNGLIKREDIDKYVTDIVSALKSM